MSVAKSSIELYGALAREIASYRREGVEKNDIDQLLDYIKRELIVSNHSSLIDTAYWSCQRFFSTNHMPVYKFEPSSFFVSGSGKHTEIPVFDAWFIIVFLSKYLAIGAITEDIERFLPYFFGNDIPPDLRPDVFYKTLQKIDAGIFECRKTMYSLYSSGTDAAPEGSSSRDNVSVVHSKQVEDRSAAVTEDIEKEKEEILDSARQQAEEERQKIINTANEEADRIIQRASFEAEQKTSVARRKFLETIENNREESVKEAQLLQHDFSEVRSALFKANEMIKKLEDTVSESSIKKVSSQLLELFNLIADTKDSTVDLAKKSNDKNLENTAYNMDVFLDMIIEYMAEYGIQSIISMPGDKFSPKNHTIGTGNQQFDPRSASIKVSKRTGFLWGEQVLQKEQVEI